MEKSDKAYRRLIVFILVFGFSLNISYFKVSSAERLLKVTGDNNYPPYEFMDEAGNYVGFNIDIINAISLEMESRIKFMPQEWDTALKMLQNGEADLIQGVSYSDGRNEVFDFSDEIVSNSQSIFVRKDDAVIFGSANLDGKTVSVQKNDISKEIIEKKNFKKVIVKEYETQELAIDALINGEVDAFVGNRVTGLYYIQSKDKSDKVKIADELEKTGSYSIAVKKGNEELLEEVNKALASIKTNGTYEKISKKWLGENIENTDKWKNLFKILSFVLGLFVALILVSVYLNRKLKKEVNLRTEEINKENILKAKILEGMNSGVIGFNSKGKVKIYNEVVGEILGEKLEIGDSYEKILFLCNLGIERLRTVSVTEEIKTEKDGLTKHLRIRTVPLEYESSDNGFLVTIYDFTNDKKTNDILSQNDKMQSIGVLSAGLAHEIRNPLTSIKMFVDMLPENSENKEFMSTFMRIVPDELTRLDRLTHTLLDYSKEAQSEPRISDLKDILEEVMLLIKPYIKKKRIKIIENYSSVNFLIDPYQLKQIVLNILMNSVDSMFEHGLIKVSGSKEDFSVKIVIEDNGCGIEKEKMDKIFEPFYTSKSTGYGIGLSVTKKLVLENSGEIFVESEVGVGTKTTIVFPASPEEDNIKRID